MTQEQVSELTITELNNFAAMAVRAAAALSPSLEANINGVVEVGFSPATSDRHALIVASALDMSISFGDDVCLVSEPAGYLSRTVSYEGGALPGRISAMRRAITLLAADCAQYI